LAGQSRHDIAKDFRPVGLAANVPMLVVATPSIPAKDLAEFYESSTKKQWTQPIGFAHALFEVASDALKRSKSLKAADVRDAVAASKLKTVVGDVAWGGQGPFKNVSKTPLVLGQWNKGKKYKYELSIVNNETAKNIPTDSKLRLN
jgi:branched-chain amino acid transport system substrate-binding protein